MHECMAAITVNIILNIDTSVSGFIIARVINGHALFIKQLIAVYYSYSFRSCSERHESTLYYIDLV